MNCGRLFTWPADQPRLALRVHSPSSKPVRPHDEPQRSLHVTPRPDTSSSAKKREEAGEGLLHGAWHHHSSARLADGLTAGPVAFQRAAEPCPAGRVVAAVSAERDARFRERHRGPIRRTIVTATAVPGTVPNGLPPPVAGTVSLPRGANRSLAVHGRSRRFRPSRPRPEDANRRTRPQGRVTQRARERNWRRTAPGERRPPPPGPLASTRWVGP
jgi:hypothetical protein